MLDNEAEDDDGFDAELPVFGVVDPVEDRLDLEGKLHFALGHLQLMMSVI